MKKFDVEKGLDIIIRSLKRAYSPQYIKHVEVQNLPCRENSKISFCVR